MLELHQDASRVDFVPLEFVARAFSCHPSKKTTPKSLAVAFAPVVWLLWWVVLGAVWSVLEGQLTRSRDPLQVRFRASLTAFLHGFYSVKIKRKGLGGFPVGFATIFTIYPKKGSHNERILENEHSRDNFSSTGVVAVWRSEW